jgi:galactonate dehydratase
MSTKEMSLPTATSPSLAHTRVSNQGHTPHSLDHDTRQSNPHLAALQGEEGEEAISSRNSPEPNQTDLEGHYVGPSSGVSFLLRVQKRIHENVAVFSNGPIFNFGDAPLPKHDSHFLVLPPKDEANILVNRYFDFAFPTHRFLHQATIETWLDTFYSDVHGSDDSLSQSVKALLLMVMVQGKQYLPNQGPAVGQSVKRYLTFPTVVFAKKSQPANTPSKQRVLCRI